MNISTLLTALFVTLKLIGQIDWSWIWVLSPLWIVWTIIFSIAFLGNLVRYMKK